MGNTTISEIRSCLEDDLSKSIFDSSFDCFMWRCEFGIVDMVNWLVESSKKNDVGLFEGHDNIVLYGFGSVGQYLLGTLGNKVLAICDSEETKQNRKILDVSVISPKELKEKYSNCSVVVSVLDDAVISEIYASLLKLEFEQNQIIIAKHEIEKQNRRRVIPQYFDSSIVKPSGKDEVFIDAGCYDFTTSQEFIHWCDGNYKRIIAFEPNPEQHSICTRKANAVANAGVHPLALFKENSEIYFNNGIGLSSRIADKSEETIKIKAVKLDDFLKGESATFIKMDIEGAELDALKGAEVTIKKYRPKLAICVYHKPEDMWEIPSYIKSLHNDYKLYLRCYPFTWGNCSNISLEKVLYAV